jgi:hypothetical protein
MLTDLTLELPVITWNVVATINTPEGILEIFHTIDSGKVITRKKIGTWTNVCHPGVIIGNDRFGRTWIAHNHISNKKPIIELFAGFLDGDKFEWDYKEAKYSNDVIVERAIAEVQKSKRYDIIGYNCQTFVNLIVRNEHSSEAVDKLSDISLVIGIIVTLIGAICKNKVVMASGLGIAGAVGVTKLHSRNYKI